MILSAKDIAFSLSFDFLIIPVFIKWLFTTITKNECLINQKRAGDKKS